MKDTAVLAVEFHTALGRIRGRVSVETGPMSLANLVSTALELTDILVEKAKRKETFAGRNISCRGGCGACCCQMVPLSPPEVFYLMDLIDSFKKDHKLEILRRFDIIEANLKEKDLIDQLMTPKYLDAPVLAVAKEYFHLGMPCPFLIDQSCSIYEYRPVACREYNVTSPPEYCTDPYQYEVQKIPMPLPLSAPLSRLTAELTGSEPCLIPLTLAFRWGYEHSRLRNASWAGVGLFQRFMGIVGKPAA